MIIAHSLSKSFEDKLILDNVSFTLKAGDRVALVGENGVGKSTLLRMVAGVESLDEGSIDTTGTIGYLPQIRDRASLSSGEQTWEQLQELLATQPDFLLLDEPTNHLDIQRLSRLERQLAKFAGGILMASHDRAFLDSCATKIFELERGKLSVYGGNYSDYKAQKKLQYDAQKRDYIVLERHRKAIEKRVTEVKRGVQILEINTSGTDHYVRRKAAKGAKSALAMVKRLQKEIEDSGIVKPPVDFSLALLFAPKRDSSQTVVFSKELYINRGERVALVGPNGSGKTTLIKKIMAGELEIGNNVEIGYLPQEVEGGMDLSENLLDHLQATTEVTKTDAYKIARIFLFSEEDMDTPVSLLSSGQQSRLRLAQIMAQRANFLIFDEPTNHLDIKAREALELALANYKGTLLVVSHDQYFLEQLKIDRMIRLG